MEVSSLVFVNAYGGLLVLATVHCASELPQYDVDYSTFDIQESIPCSAYCICNDSM